jgi:hypothetical protein
MAKKQNKKSSTDKSESTVKQEQVADKKLVILNRTNQKQVVEHKGKTTVFNAGEKKTYTKNVDSVLESFKYYIDSNILKQIN